MGNQEYELTRPDQLTQLPEGTDLSTVEIAPVVMNNETYSAPLSLLKGEKGDKGDTGLQGEQGIQGIQGEQGIQGNQGNPGTDGREVEIQKSLTHIQWRYVGDTSWTDVVALIDLKGDKGDTGNAGSDGREIELQKTTTHVQWRYVGDVTWIDLVPLADITGPQGIPGNDGVSSYTYVAYASDNTGTGFSLTPSDALKYRAEIQVTLPLDPPTATDFSGVDWVKYIGEDGQGVGDMLKSTYDPNNKNGDAFDRANHIGEQAISTITGLQGELDGKAEGSNVLEKDNTTPYTPTLAHHPATKQFVEDSMSAIYEDKGELDCSTNPNYPAGEVGDSYYVSIAGFIGGLSGKAVEVGDTIRCKTDNAGGDEATVGSSWYVVQGNTEKATQSEAEAGTNDAKVMTPLKAKQGFIYQGLNYVFSGLNTTSQNIIGAINELFSGKADKSNVLELDNTTPFTPDTDYEPATKKYVDDNAGGGGMSHAQDIAVQQGGWSANDSTTSIEGWGLIEGPSVSDSSSTSNVTEDGRYLAQITDGSNGGSASIYCLDSRVRFRFDCLPIMAFRFSLYQSDDVAFFAKISNLDDAPVQGGEFAGLEYDTDSGDDNFYFVTRDGTTTNRVDTGVPIDANVHTVVIEVLSVTSVKMSLYSATGALEASSTISANLPDFDTELTPVIGVTSRESSSKSYRFFNAGIKLMKSAIQ